MSRLFELLLPLVATLLLATSARAHELRPGYLRLTQTGPDTYDVLFKVPAKGGRRLGIYARFSDRVEVTREPVGRFEDNAYLERFAIRCRDGLVGETLRIEGLRRMKTDVLVRIEREDGSTQVGRVTPIAPEWTVEAAPGPLEKTLTYATLGVEHILLGLDHLLFVLGLLLLVDRRLVLLKTITAFTVAHSVTLAAATLGLARIPMEPLNAAIALSILFLGPEIVRRWRGQTSLTLRHPWLVAFGFGLLHGFGFASGLEALGLPPDETLWALLWFNLGVEVGQLGFVVLALAMVRAFKELELDWPRPVRRLPAFVVGGCGAWWTFETLDVMLT